MKKIVYHLWLPVLLVMAASAILLLSDWGRRQEKARPLSSQDAQNSAQARSKGPLPGKHYAVALSYFVPAEPFEQAIQGFRDGLKAKGYFEGQNLTIYAAHTNADMSMLSQVTLSLANKNPDVFVPFSTPCLGNAVQLIKDKPVVFGLVSAPFEAKAGKSYDDHLPNVTGAVQKLPSEHLYRWARKLFPDASRIGTLYNPAEANAVSEVEQLKEIYPKFGFELVALSVANTNEVAQAAQVIVEKDIDLFLAMADNTVVNGLPGVLKLCQEKGIPVIADDESLMGSGALLSCGPGPYSEGFHAAEMTARVLEGESPAKMPFELSNTFSLQLDFKAAKRLGVSLPEEFIQELDYRYNLVSRTGKPAKIAIVNLVDNAALEKARDGILSGLKKNGLISGRDFQVKEYCAQGELSMLPQIFDTALQETPDVVVSLTTPAMVAGAKKVKDIPFVFSVASDPKEIGLFSGEIPVNITGVRDDPPVEKLLKMAKGYNAELKAVGMVYDASQPQSLLSVRKLRAAGQVLDIKVLEATVSTVSDLPMATQSVVQRGANALIVTTDNLAVTGFSVIKKVAAQANVPIFVSNMSLIKEGAVGGIGNDYQAWGEQTASQVAKILSGLPPSSIPIELTQNDIVVKPKKSLAVGGKGPLDFGLVMYNNTTFSEECARGLKDGFAKGGMQEGKDYLLRELNAQGDMSTLSSIMTSINADQVDLLMVISTPTLQAALRQAGAHTKIVFTGVGDGVGAGAGKSETDHLANVTGITTRSPFKAMARSISETLPGASAVGTLFTPAEINSELYRKWFEEALAEYSIKLVSVPVMASAETLQAATALCREEIQAVAQIVDNTTRPGFAQIAKRAADNNLPVFVFDSSQMKDGATLCMARDYYEAGLEAAEKALKVLAGTSPKDIPFSNTRSEKVIINIDLAKKYGLSVSNELLGAATHYQGESSTNKQL